MARSTSGDVSSKISLDYALIHFWDFSDALEAQYRSGARLGSLDCLLDIALIWLREDDAVFYFPSFDSWMQFLLIYAEETLGIREDGSSDLRWVGSLFPPVGTTSIIEHRRDLFTRHATSGRTVRFEHPALSRSVWKAAASAFAERERCKTSGAPRRTQ